MKKNYINKNSKKTVFVGISGGVDSAVSAKILKNQNYNVVGVFIRTWHPDFLECNEEKERQDAMRICAHLDIPFLTFDLEEVYKKEVADYMISEYKLGRTPNPDVMCNKEVKFGAFLKIAISMGADYVATGHYAQNVVFRDDLIKNKNMKNTFAQVLPRPSDFGQGGSPMAQPDHLQKHSSYFLLMKSKDESKDQVYFLWTLKQEQLNKILFPIGNLKKTEVRLLAKKYKLPVSEKKDSQGICFLGKVDLKEFLKHYIKEKKGIVLNEKGEEIGYHDGITFFTLGERHGFTIIKKGAKDKPYYVIKKDFKKNILYVSNNKIENKQNSLILLKDINWISFLPRINKNYKAQIRYHGEFLNCKILKLEKKEVQVEFEKNIQVASGQSIVFYDENIVLGGGVVI